MALTAQTTAVVLELLEEQCGFVEDYANAQTMLYNATEAKGAAASSVRSVLDAVETLEQAKTRVRSNFLRLREAAGCNNADDHRDQARNPRLDRHMDLSQRVVGTIAGGVSWHANGLPAPGGGDGREGVVSNTVAIAALRASAAEVKREIGGD